MEWLEQNLDAYRIIAELLHDLRVAIRSKLIKVHGSQWYKTGIDAEVFDHLVASKEGSTEISWYETEYQEIIVFAQFPDLLAMLQRNKKHFPELLGLVQTPSLLEARFLELEALRLKLAAARAINDAEVSFLANFHSRFRRALHEGASESPADRSAAAQPPVSADGDSEEEIDIIEGGAEDLAVPNRETDGGDTEATSDEKAGADAEKTPPPEDEQLESQAPSDDEPAEDVSEDGTTDEAPTKHTSPVHHRPLRPPVRAPKSTPRTTPQKDDAAVELKPLNQALNEQDSTAILRRLFQEVTSLAENLWSSEVPPSPSVWRTVRSSEWYENSFSELGLKPLSDFYEIIDQVEERMHHGIAKHELQQMLEEANFAKILLSLRDMFQKNKI